MKAGWLAGAASQRYPRQIHTVTTDFANVLAEHRAMASPESTGGVVAFNEASLPDARLNYA